MSLTAADVRAVFTKWFGDQGSAIVDAIVADAVDQAATATAAAIVAAAGTFGDDVVLLHGDPAPTDGIAGTGAGVAGPGSLYVAITVPLLYQNTNTKASPTWTVVGTQS